MATRDPSSPEIVCVTLNPAIDRTLEVSSLELGQHVKGRLVSRQPAGKAVNVARVLQHLGQSCILTGFVGESERGMFESSFDSAIVRTQLFGLASPTRENITLVDTAKGIETHIRDEGAGIQEDDRQRLVKKLRILAKPEAWMVFAGSLPHGLSTAGFSDMLQAVRDRGAKIVLDSSEGALAVIRSVPVWLIKPNRSELSALTGLPTGTADEIVRAISAVPGEVSTVLASAGEEGCFLAENGNVRHAWMEPLPRKVASTVGSGDALLAGLLAARALGLDDETALKRAVATATSACFQVQTGDIDAAELNDLAARVRVESLSG